MAKKRKRTVKRTTSSDVDAVDEADEEGEWEEVKDQPADLPSPGIPRVMVTWNGSEGSKQWYGLIFEAGVPQSVERTPFWDAMRKDIDRARSGDWSYEHVIEHPEEK